MLASALSLSLLLGFSACGPRLENRNIDAVNRLYEQAEKSGKAVSIKEVEAVLGQPDTMQPFPIEMQTTKELQGVRYYYKRSGQTIELHFVDNKLIRRIDHFGETPAPEGSEEHRMMVRPPRPAPASPEPEQPKATPGQTN